MTTQEAHRFLQRNRRRLIRLFNLEHYEIILQCKELEKETMGQCHVITPYRRIRIEIDPAKHKNEKELWNTVRHEFLHTILFPVEQMIDTAFLALKDHKLHRSFVEEAFAVAKEQIVFNLERFAPIKSLRPPAENK